VGDDARDPLRHFRARGLVGDRRSTAGLGLARVRRGRVPRRLHHVLDLALETVRLIQRNEVAVAIVSVSLNVVRAVTAAAFGMVLARRLL
jgi:hypothetical protein